MKERGRTSWTERECGSEGTREGGDRYIENEGEGMREYAVDK